MVKNVIFVNILKCLKAFFNIMGFWKNLKRSKTANTIKICPKCQKPQLYRTTLGSFTNTEFYNCRNCDYEGAFYLEYNPDEDGSNFADLEEFKEKYPEFVDSEEI
jgi:predicted RNA-binding Zn-ribbon protein involved in translation (DUF1610 family)